MLSCKIHACFTKLFTVVIRPAPDPYLHSLFVHTTCVDKRVNVQTSNCRHQQAKMRFRDNVYSEEVCNIEMLAVGTGVALGEG